MSYTFVGSLPEGQAAVAQESVDGVKNGEMTKDSV
jgi:hypothetical protein